MTNGIDKIITYRSAYGTPSTSFYEGGKEVEIKSMGPLNKKLQESIKNDARLLDDNPKIMRIFTKV